MILYHLTTIGKAYGKHKIIFPRRKDMIDFLEDLKTKKPRTSASVLKKWEKKSQENKELYLMERISITKIDISKIPNWRKLFKGHLIKEYAGIIT